MKRFDKVRNLGLDIVKVVKKKHLNNNKYINWL